MNTDRRSPCYAKTDTSYLFIDAGYLNHRLKSWSEKYFDGTLIEIDYQKLTEKYTKTFYYDGLAEEDEKHKTFLNSLREIPDFHVFTGSIKGKNKRQKQVDVMLAVHALTHTIRGNMDHLTLLAGDEDFTPLIAALIQEGMTVTIWAANESISKELSYSADRKLPLKAVDLWNSATTEEFKTKYPLPKRVNISPVAKHNLEHDKNVLKPVTDDGNSVYIIDKSEENYILLAHPKQNNLQITGKKSDVVRFLRAQEDNHVANIIELSDVELMLKIPSDQ